MIEPGSEGPLALASRVPASPPRPPRTSRPEIPGARFAQPTRRRGPIRRRLRMNQRGRGEIDARPRRLRTRVSRRGPRRHRDVSASFSSRRPGLSTHGRPCPRAQRYQRRENLNGGALVPHAQGSSMSERRAASSAEDRTCAPGAGRTIQPGARRRVRKRVARCRELAARRGEARRKRTRAIMGWPNLPPRGVRQGAEKVKVTQTARARAERSLREPSPQTAPSRPQFEQEQAPPPRADTAGSRCQTRRRSTSAWNCPGSTNALEIAAREARALAQSRISMSERGGAQRSGRSADARVHTMHGAISWRSDCGTRVAPDRGRHRLRHRRPPSRTARGIQAATQ